MVILKKDELIEKVEEAILSNGWNVDNISGILLQPVKFKISKEEKKEILLVYIWNLSHGGKSRSENEFRIQVKVDKFDEEEDSKSLILGYWDEMNIFAGFDIKKHIGKPAWSASMQIKKDVLEDARINQVAKQIKDNGEIAIAFNSTFFMNYVENYEEIHSTGDIEKFTRGFNQEIPIEDDIQDETIEFRYSIISYGADYPVDSIIKRIENQTIFVPPFQRNFVWNIKEASRFIESLILGLPVPGVFLSREESTGRLLILDGQQRLFSLYSFYKNNFKNKEFRLKGVLPDLEGRTYEDLTTSDKIRLDDSIIHATIVKQDEPDDSESSTYAIFERLNSSGKVLTPQEIRACVYYGDFNEYLNEIVREPDWRKIFGATINERLKEQELLLRFFTLFFEYENYQKPLKSFLNVFMSSNRQLTKYDAETLNNIIKPSINYIADTLGKQAFRYGRSVNAALFDSIMIGITKRINAKSSSPDKKEFIRLYYDLLKNPDFIAVVQQGTSNESSVSGRILMAISKFEELE